jgi:hypothetical protein
MGCIISSLQEVIGCPPAPTDACGLMNTGELVLNWDLEKRPTVFLGQVCRAFRNRLVDVPTLEEQERRKQRFVQALHPCGDAAGQSSGDLLLPLYSLLWRQQTLLCQGIRGAENVAHAFDVRISMTSYTFCRGSACARTGCTQEQNPCLVAAHGSCAFRWCGIGYTSELCSC